MTKEKSNIFGLWKRGMYRGCITIIRERDWMAALGALTGVFLLFQLLIFILLGVEGIQTLLRARTDVRLEIVASANDQDILEFISSIEQLPYIENHIYVTREQAYAQMQKKDPELVNFIEEFGLENPFPETVSVTLTSLNAYEDFQNFVEADKWNTVVDPNFLSEATEQETHIHSLLRITSAGQSLAFAFLGLTAVVLIFVTMELVRRRVLSRSEEILVEHLSGAHTFAILLPYATEACILLIVAAAASTILVALVMFALPFVIPEIGTDGALSSLMAYTTPLLGSKMPLLIGIEFLFLPILAWLGAWLGVLPKINPRALALHRQ